MWQKLFFISASMIVLILSGLTWINPFYGYLFIIVLPLIMLGIFDSYSKNNVLYNYQT